MPGPYAPDDSLFGPIIHTLATILQNGIPSITYIWEKTPDRAPSNNQVLLPILKVHVVDDTNGKLKIRITIGARHLFRRNELDAGLGVAYSYIMPWLFLLSAWPDQTLGGLAISVTPTDVMPAKIVESGQTFVALAVDFNVLTEFNIPVV